MTRCNAKQSYMLKVLRVGEAAPAASLHEQDACWNYWNEVIKQQVWFDQNKEVIVVLLFSPQLVIEGYALVSIGSLTEAIAHPREIFRAAVAAGCYGIVVMHNHPSGDPNPSDADENLTQRLHAAGEILQIPLLDHVIVGCQLVTCPTRARMSRETARRRDIATRGYFSFADHGLL